MINTNNCIIYTVNTHQHVCISACQPVNQDYNMSFNKVHSSLFTHNAFIYPLLSLYLY